MIGASGDQPLGADRVARIEHRDVRLRAHHRQIFERHLRRSVLANRHAGVRPGHLDVQVADRRHADEVGARVRNAANVDGNGIAPRAASPIAAPIITCSAMKFW